MSLSKVKKLLDYYEKGKIPVLSQHEVHPNIPPSSRENYLYFTLPVCINFQRNSSAMWTAALHTWNDKNTRYLFFPEKLAKIPLEKIRDDLLKHRLGLQPNKHTLIWTTIAKTLHLYYADDPRNIITQAAGDAGKLIEILQVTYKQRFPYLRGPKLSNYWPYILSQYTDVNFLNAQEISIIPDTHVLQASVVLGIVKPGASSKQVETAWKEILKDTDINPSRVHPALWNWSRNKFEPEV